MNTSEVQLLVQKYLHGVRYFSFEYQMRREPAFEQLVALGTDAVPALIDQLKSEGGSQAIHLLLRQITGAMPYIPVVEGGFAKWSVQAEADAWLTWANRRKADQ